MFRPGCCKYSKINPTSSPASSAGNASEPRMMPKVGKVCENRVHVYQCVSAVRVVEVPILACLNNRCYHVTERRGP
jgi:hypothetical protein